MFWNDGDFNAVALAFWPMAALALPVLFLIPAQTVRAGWIRRLGTIVALVAISASMLHTVAGLWIVVYTGALGLLAQLDSADENSFWKRPLTKIGIFGLIALFFILTSHHEVIKEFCRTTSYRGHVAWDGKTLTFDFLAAIGMLVASIAVMTINIMRQRWMRVLVGSSALVAAAAWWMAYTGDYYKSGYSVPVAFWLCNAWLATFGLYMVLTGIKSSSMKRLNVGMLIMLWVILIRFFDSEFPMTVRSIVFMLCGAGFVATNIILARRFKMKGTSV